MKTRYTDEQIIGFLKQAAAGTPVKDLCRKHGFSDASFYIWRQKFGGMEVPDAKRLRALEGELTLRFVGGPAAPAVLVRTSPGPVSQARYALYPRSGGDPVTADWRDFPVLARAVTTGVSVHEGIFFGSAGLWLNTATAAVLVWVCAGGTAAWWARTPA